MKRSLIFTTGLAMFSMFFGSGNLVFPVRVGFESQGHYILASLGIILTGVLVPFLGMFALYLYGGNQDAFFARFGRNANFLFSLFSLSILGPFGVVARCITVAHASFGPIASVNFLFFGALFALLAFLCAVNRKQIIPLLGNILTPALLLSLLGITYFGLTRATFPTATPGEGWHSFQTGLTEGYQTMDLLAAFFFSTFIIQSLSRYSQLDNRTSLKIFLTSSLWAALLLAAVYFVLVILGASYTHVIDGLPPETMISAIIHSILGTLAGPIVCAAVVLACLTTAVALGSLFSDFIRTEIFKGKIGNKTSLTLTLLIAYATSTLKFSGIMSFLGPILEFVYPVLIAVTLFNIAHKLIRRPVGIVG